MSRSSRSLRALVALGLIASLITVPAGSASGDGSRGGPASVDAADVQAASTGTGYWMLDDDGEVYAFGDAEDLGDATGFATSSGFAGLIPTVTGQGYWILTRTGFLLEFGDAADHGDPLDQRAGSSLFSSAIATPSGLGLWAFTADGQVIALGDATHHGDLTGLSINGEIVDAALTPSGGGYWLLGSEGGIFAFGDAAFLGSIQGVIEDQGLSVPAEQWLNAPIVGLVASPTGDGYWLVAADGGIFAFGNAPFRGSVPGVVNGPLARPINGMVPYGNGYLMVASDGGVFTFSDQPFLGSLGANPPSDPVIGISPLPPAPLNAVAARVDNDPSSPVLYEVDFAPNQAGIASVQAFGDRSTSPPTVTGFRLTGDHVRFPIDLHLRDDGRLGLVEMGDGTSVRVLSYGSSTIKVEVTDADGEVSATSIRAPRERVDVGVGVASSGLRSAAERRRTIWSSTPAHLDVRLTTISGAAIDEAPIPVRTHCTLIECRAPSLQATNDVEVLLGVPLVLNSFTIDETKDCESFQWHFNTHVGWTIPALVGILALPPVGVLSGGWSFVLATAIAGVPAVVGIDCDVLSAEARRDAVFEELARIEPTVTMEVTPNFGLYRLLDPTKTVSFPVTQRILSGGGRIGSLVFEGALHVSHNIVDVHHDSSVRAGETLELEVVVVGGEASGLGPETIDHLAASIGSRVVDTATGDARLRLRDRTYRLSVLLDEPGVHTIDIVSSNGRTPTGRWVHRDTHTVSVLVTPPLAENCVELDHVGLGEVCTDAPITAGDHSLVFVENISESTECFRDAPGDTADWTGRHIGEYRYTTNVAAVRDSVTADGQWRSRFTVTCLAWAFRQSTFEVTVIRTGLSFRSADDLLDAIGNELGRNPECEEFGWPSCELALHGRTGTMNKDDAQ